ncbi:MAG: nitrate/nitrite transporter NrtS [Actinomycetota bacterium]
MRTTLRKTIRIALVVGTILSLINQAGVIFGGDATTVTWIRVGANYLVPFCVSSAGFLSATRRTRS